MTIVRGLDASNVKTSGTSNCGASSLRGRSGPQASCTSSIEPFVDLLDFGSSVVVNEEIIRVIAGEVHEIEESINVIDSEAKKEATVERQLRQDLLHSHSELSNLSRGAIYQLENVNVHSTFLRGLDDALQADLVMSSGIKRGSISRALSPDPAGVRAGQDATEGEDTQRSSQGNETYKEIIQRRSEKLKEVIATMKETSKEVDGFFEMQRNTIEAINATHRRLETEGLHTALEQKKREGDRLIEESKQEMEKLQSFKLAISKSRTERCSIAQELADLIKEQEETRSKVATERKVLLTKLAVHSDSTKRRQAELHQTKSMLEKAMADIQELSNQKQLMHSFAETKAALDQEKNRKDELLHLEAELVAKLKASEEELEGTKEKLQNAKERESKALKLKAENDEIHRTIFVPGRLELSEIAEKKEKVSKLIEACQRSNSELEISEKELLESKLATKRAVLEDLAALREEEKSTRAKKESIRLVNEQSKDTWEFDIEEHIRHEKQLRAASEAKRVQLEELQQAQSKRREESVKECIKLAENEKAKAERLVKILKRGVDVIQEAESRLGKLGKCLEW